MKKLLLLGFAATVLLLPTASAASVTHYVPQTGDGFHYAETIVLDNGVGSYQGYTEHTFINGTIGITGVPPNLTASASYSNTNAWQNNTGSTSKWTSSGTFTFSAVTFQYVQGTDNQTGYYKPYVWFYINNQLTQGSSFYLLNTQMNVVETNATYQVPAGPLAGYVKTTYTEGNGSYTAGGGFSATYTWQAYFDPSTGYVVGYLYTEHDTDAQGDGYTVTDTLYVTSTSYPLTAASSPPASSGSSNSFPWIYVVIGVIVVIILVVIAVAVARRRSRRPRTGPLPQHSATGRVSYGPPPPPPGGAPPPINLTPSGQPAVQQIVIKETVKVKCAYCGALIDSTARACPFCGAPRN